MSFAFTDTRGLLSWVIKHGTGEDIQALCEACRGLHRFSIAEIVALAEKVGEDFNFLNRRCRCRLTPGCSGWNRFYFLSGVYRPLFTSDQAERWRERDQAAGGED